MEAATVGVPEVSASDVIEVSVKKKKSKKPKRIEPESDDSDEEGSLQDFIVRDDDSEHSEVDYGDEKEGGPSYRGRTVEDEETEAIDLANIVTGKRVRRPVTRYVDELMARRDVQRLMMHDIPKSEVKAALVDEDFSSDEESEDEEEDEGEEEESEDPPKRKKM